MSSPKIKICGLTRRVDALHAAEAGADYLGVVLVPGTPRARTPEEAREILAAASRPGVIVVSDLGLSQLQGAAEQAGASVIQLHGEESPELAFGLRKGGGWKVWKALRVRSEADVLEGFSRFDGAVDGFLLDAWHPRKKGGTGRSFSWPGVAEVRESLPRGAILVAAGGLGPKNVREAVRHLRPHVVDVSSGVERSPGIKDPRRVEAFIREVQEAGNDLAIDGGP